MLGLLHPIIPPPPLNSYIGVNPSEIIQLAKEKDTDYDTISIEESDAGNEYSGTIVVAPDRIRVISDICRGPLWRMLEGVINPDYHVNRDAFIRTFRSNDNIPPKLWSEIMSAISSIPDSDLKRESISYDREFMPGYYEFTLSQQVGKTALQPIFYGYSDKEAFQSFYPTRRRYVDAIMK